MFGNGEGVSIRILEPGYSSAAGSSPNSEVILLEKTIALELDSRLR